MSTLRSALAVYGHFEGDQDHCDVFKYKVSRYDYRKTILIVQAYGE